MKRFLIAVMCLLMVLLLTSCSTQPNIEDFKYKELEDGTLVITDYKGKASSITIPDSIDGKTVTHIGKGCFGLTSPVTNAIVPESIVSIDSGAFDCATKLTSITIKAKNIYIGKNAFAASGLKSVNIESEEIEVDEGAFYLCNKLNSFNLNNAKHVKLGKESLFGTSLKSFTLSAEEIELGEKAFQASGDLKNITFKCERLMMGVEAFQMNVHLESFTATGRDDSKALKSVVISDQCFSCCDLTSFMITSGDVRMGDEVFYNNGHLTKISVPKGTTFGIDVFKSCYKNPTIDYLE